MHSLAALERHGPRSFTGIFHGPHPIYSGEESTLMTKVNKTIHVGEDYASGGALTTREAFERGTETFNAHDMKGFGEVLADDVVFQAPGGINGKGKAACVEFFGSWFVAFPDAHVDVHNVHILDDVAVEEGTFRGTHNGVLSGPMADVPPTGRSVRVSYVHLLRFREGKHVSFHLMFDRLAMLEQLGLVPTPVAAKGL